MADHVDATILTDLWVVARLRANDKLLTYGGAKFEIQEPSVFQGLYRSWYRETRHQNVDNIVACVRRAKVMITNTLAEHSEHTGHISDRRGSVATEVLVQEERHRCKRIVQGLVAALRGLKNLQTTYRDDVALVVRIEELRVEIGHFAATVLRDVRLPDHGALPSPIGRGIFEEEQGAGQDDDVASF